MRRRWWGYNDSGWRWERNRAGRERSPQGTPCCCLFAQRPQLLCQSLFLRRGCVWEGGGFLANDDTVTRQFDPGFATEGPGCVRGGLHRGRVFGGYNRLHEWVTRPESTGYSRWAAGGFKLEFFPVVLGAPAWAGVLLTGWDDPLEEVASDLVVVGSDGLTSVGTFTCSRSVSPFL